MALAAAALTGPAPAARPVRTRHFAGLKLRVLRNGMRGSTVRILTFILSILATLYFGFAGFLIFAVPGFVDSATGAEIVAGVGGSALVFGWMFLPLVFFGVDETLDPARFALLPLSRRTLVTGLLAAALLGLPSIATLLMSTGLVAGAGSLGGWPAAGAAAVGVVLGLVLCVAISRAVTSAFATALRSRKTRDLAAVLLTGVAALLGPIQLALMNNSQDANWSTVQQVARILGWTPLGAAYTLGVDVAAGRAWTVPIKLLIVGASIAALLWWWSRSLESAMVGARGSAGAAPATSGPTGRSVELLIPRPLRWLPRNRFGALVARDARLWWREARRRASLITVGVIGVVMPVIFISNDSASTWLPSFSMAFVGLMGALNLANQFGFEGTAYATNMIAGVPGRTELHSRALGLSVYMVPALVILAVVTGARRDPAWIPALLGAALAAYGVGVALATLASVVGAYAMPDTSNPFAISSGGGVLKSLLSFAVLLGSGVATVPYLLIALATDDAWLWLALPVGLAYGGGAYWLGLRLSAAILDRRMPELLATVNPRR
jgi:ABC-2 type transport system permease protein